MSLQEGHFQTYYMIIEVPPNLVFYEVKNLSQEEVCR